MNTLHHQLRLPGPLPPGFHGKLQKVQVQLPAVNISSRPVEQRENVW